MGGMLASAFVPTSREKDQAGVVEPVVTFLESERTNILKN